MTEFTDLALEIQQDTGVDTETAYRLAWQQMAELLNDVMMDVRYTPCRVVMFDARELWDFTGGDNGR